MIRTVFLTSLLALAAPAVAQDASSPPSPPESGTPPATDPATETPAQPSARPATEQEVGTLVAGEFPRRDLDSNGSLNQEEFTSWLGELMSRSPGGAAGGDPDARVASAFGQADADGSGTVSPAEMIALLSRHH
ncbi:EF-hand domain-containing protein [Sphingosinicella terrae]|jgi:hypothetical protein|uniref:EF-hand domain-containing protein n=1 Tax=Sphingosinicella terrae TaxID=2172047 RepID=UPI000E0D3C17|nr:EF-hand domain-containing protein [Sphingosinicella terrae]